MVASSGRTYRPRRGPAWALHLDGPTATLTLPSTPTSQDGPAADASSPLPGGAPGRSLALDPVELTVRRRWWGGATLVWSSPAGNHTATDPDPATSPPRKLGGLGWRQMRSLRLDLAAAIDQARRHRTAVPAIEALAAWYGRVTSTLDEAVEELRWITTEQADALLEAAPDLHHLGQQLMVRGLWETLDPQVQETLGWDRTHVTDRIAATNARIVTTALVEHREFFDTIEATPLTDEQARAVITHDNRVHVLAAAGSGKTSVMVARAAYAVWRGHVAPSNILMLAFNAAAATELADRVARRFAAAGIPGGDQVRATTFHAHGLEVIAAATGRKPSVAPWVADGRDVEVLADIVTDLRATSDAFAHHWDLFRLLYARVGDDWADLLGADGADAWDPERRRGGLATYAGDVVRSQGERLLADWLYLNHVTYEYERPFDHDTATVAHRQYTPDFYYPETGTWHEHWGVDAHGNPPPSWRGYAEQMRWKRQLHADLGTDLIETTWAGVMSRRDFHRLADELDKRGIARRWDPDRPTRAAKPVKDSDVLRLMRSFMSHVKSNRLTPEKVESRLVGGHVANTDRARLFCDLYWPVHHAWQQRLADGGYVDFDDMLTQAADHLEHPTEAATGLAPGTGIGTGAGTGAVAAAGSPEAASWQLVCVDEFQDVSQARARLTRALVSGPGRCLLAVGDDWQSINRFAGADLSVLTGFASYFGPGPVLQLTRTFRCHANTAAAATRFVTRNPAQTTKQVRSVRTGPHPHLTPPPLTHAASGPTAAPAAGPAAEPAAEPAAGPAVGRGDSPGVAGGRRSAGGGALCGVELRQVASPRELSAGIAEILDELATATRAPTADATGRSHTEQSHPSQSSRGEGRVSVLVLGRYRHERDLLPAAAVRACADVLDVSFSTIHAAKGLESDFVIVASLAAGTFGFPSQIVDDPVLALAMSAPERFEHAEERRLLYVALTRSRWGTYLLVPETNPSVFATELLSSDTLARVVGGAEESTVCPTCRRGVLRPRHGTHGAFFGCSRFPACRHTANTLPAR